MTPWSVRQYCDDRGMKPVEVFFVVPGPLGITRVERAKFQLYVKYVGQHGLGLLSRQSALLESVQGLQNLYSIRLNRTRNNPRVLACALSGDKTIVLLHVFKETDRKAYSRALLIAVVRRDRVMEDPLRWTRRVGPG